MTILTRLHPAFNIRLRGAGATDTEINLLKSQFPLLPDDYVDIVTEASAEIELKNGRRYYDPKDQGNLFFIWVWGVKRCLDEANSLSHHVSNAIPLGTDLGDSVYVYMDGQHGMGIYLIYYQILSRDSATWVSPSLADLLIQGVGIASVLEHCYGQPLSPI